MDEKAREAQRAYMREWRRKNKDKVRESNRREMEIEMIPFQKIPDASKTTGLSQYYLRNGCKDGSVPHIKSGTVYLVNIPALLRKLGVENDERQKENPPRW